MSLKKSLETTVNPIIESAKSKRIIHLETDDTMLTQNLLATDRGILNNFGSCSYLGMEFDERLLEGSVDAIRRFGTQFSASRAYMSISLYTELENLMEQIAGAPVLITPTTTLGHLSIIPTIVGSDDAVIMDHQVHNSVQMALKPVKLGKTRVEVLRHNRMDLLRDRVQELSKTSEHVWYMADGIYSMFGDACPLDELYALLDEFPKFHLYVDDAHGMSCYGKHGEGYVLSHRPIHERMVVALSMAKAFASGGAVFAFGNQEWRDLSRNCGGPMITSGPIQPAVLGASVAMAKIQLSGAFAKLRDELQHKIQFMNDLLTMHELPLIANNTSPIFFVGTSKPEIAKNIVDRMIKLGYFLNLGIYPAVPIKNTGVRFTITRMHTKEAMRDMVTRFARVYKEEMAKADFTKEEVYKAFKIKQPVLEEMELDRQRDSLTVKTFSSITELDVEQWDTCFQHNRMLRSEQLVCAELGSGMKVSNGLWKNRYIMIEDARGKVICAAPVSITITKDDMLASNDVSVLAEHRREKDPSYLTSRTVMTGLPYSTGEHLFIDKSGDWKRAVNLCLGTLESIREEFNGSQIILRDFAIEDKELMQHLAEQGYFKAELMPSYHVEEMNWDTQEEFIQLLSKRSKKHFKQDVRRHQDKFTIELSEHMDSHTLKHVYGLFRNVHTRSTRLNTYALPYSLVASMNNSPLWKCLLVKVRMENEDCVVGCAWLHVSGEVVDFPMVGIDYDYQEELKVYQQTLYQTYAYAKSIGARRLNWGYTADVEKRKFGAIASTMYCMVQTDDNYTQSLLMEMSEQRPVAV